MVIDSTTKEDSDNYWPATLFDLYVNKISYKLQIDFCFANISLSLLVSGDDTNIAVSNCKKQLLAQETQGNII